MPRIGLQMKTLLLATAVLSAASLCAPLSLAGAHHTPGTKKAASHHAPYAYGGRLIVLSTPRDGVLLNPNPHRGNVRGFTGGSSANAYDPQSHLPYGASSDQIQEMLLVLPRENVPAIAISPWEPITDRTIDQLRRDYPWLRRTESIRQDLIFAQNQYLREHRYIGSVRSFTNRRTPETRPYSSDEFQTFAPPAAQDQPRQRPTQSMLVVRPSGSQPAADALNLNEDSVIRVHTSEPGVEE